MIKLKIPKSKNNIEDSSDLRTNLLFQVFEENLDIRNGFVVNRQIISICSKAFNVMKGTDKETSEDTQISVLKKLLNLNSEIDNLDKIEYILNQYNRKKIYKTFSYNGSKLKFEVPVNKALERIFNADIEFDITSVISLCLGSMAGLISQFERLKQHGVDNLILNDLNLTLVGFFMNVYNNLKDLQNAVCEIIIEIKEHFGNLSVPREEYQTIFNFLLAKLNIYELNKEHNNIYASAIFFFLSRDSYNGIYRYDIEKNITLDITVSPDDKKRFYIFFKNIDELKAINTFLHSFKTVKFFTMDCIELLKIFKDDKTVIFDADPIYVKTNSKVLETSRGNYGFENDDFDHRLFLELLIGTNFIYYNNAHFIFDEVVQSNDLSITKILKTCGIENNKKNQLRPTTMEYLIYGSSNYDFTTESTVVSI
jgi:site-specific DNA-adenine methylase